MKMAIPKPPHPVRLNVFQYKTVALIVICTGVKLGLVP
jgi:hypothetical protein